MSVRRTLAGIVGDLGPLAVSRKTGHEQFHSGEISLDFNLLDFWQWSASDLVSNATRGILAEYIVARAIGAETDGLRNEWAAYDLTSSSGIRVEVKSAAYLQSWCQQKFSTISFVVRPTRGWDRETGKMAGVQERQAIVYVFALLACRDKSEVNPLDVRQWEFFVVPTQALNARKRSQPSITLKSLLALAAGPITYAGLAEAVQRAAIENARFRGKHPTPAKEGGPRVGGDSDS